jgi:hypothetical protein
VALTSGVFLATGSFGASVDTCANGASVFVGSAFQGWTVVFFTFSIHVSNTCLVLGTGAIGCFTCGSHSQGITVALGAGSACISGSQVLCCLFIAETAIFILYGSPVAIAFAKLYFTFAVISGLFLFSLCLQRCRWGLLRRLRNFLLVRQ